MHCYYCGITLDEFTGTCQGCHKNIEKILMGVNRHCIYCNQGICDDALFCPICGFSCDEPETAEPVVQAAPPPSELPQQVPFRSLKANNKIVEEHICKMCPEKFSIGDDIILCEKCGNYFHKKCWDRNEGCNQLGCKGETKSCPTCGSEIKKTALKCWHCGYYFDNSISHPGPNAVNNESPPKNWLTESILVTFFCCLPFGIAGWVNAAKVNPRFYAGDIKGANTAAEEAARWTKVSFWIGITIFVLKFISIVSSGYR